MIRLVGVTVQRFQPLDFSHVVIRFPQRLHSRRRMIRPPHSGRPALRKAGAPADAERILNDLLGREAVRSDPEAGRECGLLLARSLQDQSKSVEAGKQFDDLAGRYPKSVPVHVYRGRFQLSLRQAEAAAESFRTARRLAREGSASWCEATLDLASAG